MARRRLLRKRRRELERERGPAWRLGVDTQRYRRRLGQVELRDETALVDEHVRLERDLDLEGLLVAESVEPRHDFQRDRRLWSAVIRGERVLVRRFVRPQERWVLGWVETQRARYARGRKHVRELGQRRPAAGALWALVALPPLFLFFLAIRLQELLFLNVVKGQKALADTAVDLPITVRESIETSREELATQESRRRLRLSILNPRLLTPERRRTLVFLAAVVLAAAYLLSEVVIRLAFPPLADAKRQFDLVFFYAIGTRLVLPTPFEPILLTALPRLGLLFLLSAAALGALVGSWLLFLLGEQATVGLERLAERRPWLQKGLTWAQDHGRPWGYWILFALMSIPFSVDSVAALAALFKLRLDWFFVVIVTATLLRCAIFLAVFA